jgi:hypothetical protein
MLDIYTGDGIGDQYTYSEDWVLVMSMLVVKPVVISTIPGKPTVALTVTDVPIEACSGRYLATLSKLDD